MADPADLVVKAVVAADEVRVAAAADDLLNSAGPGPAIDSEKVSSG